MTRTIRPRRLAAAVAVVAVLAIGLVLVLRQVWTTTGMPAGPANAYKQVNLVSDLPGTAQRLDPKLVNPWGIAASSTSPFWVADNNAGAATVDTGAGTGFSGAPASVTIPAPAGSAADAAGAPTGIVFNGSSGFRISQAGASAPSLFLFDTEDGTIAGWSPKVSASSAVLAVDNSAVNAVYKGLAIATTSPGMFIDAATFRSGTVDVYDSNFAKVTRAGAFADPNIPAGFAPFNVHNLGGKLYVSYAKQKPDKHDDLAGAGNGFVDVYDPTGTLIRRLVSNAQLDSPWGLAMAPAGFGKFSNDLLVGNFGDGKINAFDPNSGKFLGTLADANHKAIQITGLWGLSFGNSQNAGGRDTLFFTAGVGDEKHGLIGSLVSATATSSAPSASSPPGL